MASYKNGSITLENVYGKKTYETTIAECGSSTELQELTITENGTYTAPEGTAYSPVNVNVPSKEEETKSITITENGKTTVLPTSGKVLSKVDIVANVPQTSTDTLLKDFLAVRNAKSLFSSITITDSQLESILKEKDTSACTDMTYMFSNCSNLTTIPQLDTSKVTNMNQMFYSCSNLITIPLLNTSNVTNMQGMFERCYKLTSIPLLNTSNVTNMQGMFDNCKKIITIPQLDTSNVTNMKSMFYHCLSLTTIPQLDTSNVTNMMTMFYSCSNLTTIPLLNTSKVTNMNSMFSDCSNLTTIPQLDTSKVTNMQNMFFSCSKLTKIDITHMNITSSNYSSFFAKNCNSLTKLIIHNMNTIPTLNSDAFDSCYHFYGTTNATYNPEGLKDGRIYVPDDKVDELKVATNWSVFADIIVPLSTLVEE